MLVALLAVLVGSHQLPNSVEMLFKDFPKVVNMPDLVSGVCHPGKLIEIVAETNELDDGLPVDPPR